MAVSGDLISVKDGSVALTEENWRGMSFPPENSSSAGSMATGSSSRNSNSPAEVSGSGPAGRFFAGDDDFDPASFEASSSGNSRLNEILGLSHPYDGYVAGGNFSGDMPMLLTHAEAICVIKTTMWFCVWGQDHIARK